MQAAGVLGPLPTFDQPLGLQHDAERRAAQGLLPHLAVRAVHVVVSPGRSALNAELIQSGGLILEILYPLRLNPLVGGRIFAFSGRRSAPSSQTLVPSRPRTP